jgi:hypothetical protein
MSTASPSQNFQAVEDQKELTFTDRVKFLVSLNRALMYLITEVAKLPKGGRYQFIRPDNGQTIEIGRVELKKYASALNSKFEHLGKDHNASKRKKPRKQKFDANGMPIAGMTNKLATPAYISDQLKGFFEEMLGSQAIQYTVYQDRETTNKNGKVVNKRVPLLDASGQPSQAQFSANDLGVVVNNNISVAAVNTELFTLYTYVAQTKSQTNGTRFHVTPLMEKWFGEGTNCHWIVGGQDLGYSSATANASDQELAGYGVPSDKMAKFRQDVAGLDMPALERIYDKNSKTVLDAEGRARLGSNGQPFSSYPFKKNGTQYIPYIRNNQEAMQINSQYSSLSLGNDDHGIVFAMFMVLATYFRIPTYVMGAQAGTVLVQPEVTAALEGLQRQLKDLIQTYRDRTSGNKKKPSKPKPRNVNRAALNAYGMTTVSQSSSGQNGQ